MKVRNSIVLKWEDEENEYLDTDHYGKKVYLDRVDAGMARVFKTVEDAKNFMAMYPEKPLAPYLVTITITETKL